MIRILLLGLLYSAPLLAAEQEATPALVSASVEVHLRPDEKGVSAEIAFHVVVRNDGEPGTFEFGIPLDSIPTKKNEEFAITVDTKALPAQSDSDGQYRWTLELGAGQQVDLSWSYTGGTTLLPQLHPLGRRRLTLPLAHLRRFAALPDSVSITVHYADLPAELFERTDTTPLKFAQPAGKRMEDFQLTWFASTLAARISEQEARREAFSEKQRTAVNRGFTSTLVLLADLYARAGKHVALAETCARLAELEASSNTTITHCGPSAGWRKYVPWRLLQVDALEKAGVDARQAAEAARAHMQVLWPAYLKAREGTRPFDQLDRSKHGNYWDYDWKRTRELYAHVLEVLGDNQGAESVRDVQD
ncbi:MAG: hypothetical protein H6839_03955 [Planctomycetes bacterium]|nr:hypothetical protein [Planctomycetota bacterium]